MHIRLTLAIIAAKILIKLLRLFKSGGTTLPGKVASRICPDLLSRLSVKFRTVMVTGTNGKTTVSRIIGQILDENGITHIDNRSGANLIGGIATTYLEAVSVCGKARCTAVILEVDEAAFRKVSDQVKPEVLVVTNFFRDQLDRFGELTNTVRDVKSGILKCPDTRLVLNADDSLCASLGRDVPNKLMYYGIAAEAYDRGEAAVNQDAVFCLYCKTRYNYSFRTYGHLGGFSCPECGYSRPDTDVACIDIVEMTAEGSSIRIKTESEEFDAAVNLPGLYNVYNALAATACGFSMDMPSEKTVQALGMFKCGFGRMETIEADGKTIKVILVKNPTGFNQVIEYLLSETKELNIAFLINDKIADGTDISWLWDVEFEKLKNIETHINKIFTGGIRAEDMTLRLKYAELDTSKAATIRDYSALLEQGLADTQPGNCFYILPTYTAMLDVRKVLEERYNLKEFWK